MSNFPFDKRVYTEEDINRLYKRLLPMPELPRKKVIKPKLLTLAIHWELYSKAIPLFIIPGV